MQGLLDSGATISLFGMNHMKLIDKWKLRMTSANLMIKTADGKFHTCTKKIKLPMQYDDKTHKVEVYFSPTVGKTTILGMNFWKTFGIIPTLAEIGQTKKYQPSNEVSLVEQDESTINRQSEDKFHTLTTEQTAQLEEVKGHFKISDGINLGRTDRIVHYIDTGENKPIKQKPYYSSPRIQEKINEEIDRQLKLGIIEPAKSPAWLNPIIAVNKSSGGVRLCLDARKLNACTKKNAFPQQNLNRILERVSGYKYITTIDLKDAYHQIEIDKESRPCTAFSASSKGTFQYVRMAMGLCNASSTLCELIQDIIGCDLEPYVYPYMDDFLVLTPTFEKHLEILKELAKRLAKATLTISPNKSKFCMKETSYVGYVISEKGIKANPNRMEPILKYPAPKNIKALRRFIGMSGWYRRFIRNYSTIIAPITNLLKKSNLPFKWNEEANAAFEAIKEILVAPPILSPPNFTVPFELQCDASDTGTGAVLTQTVNGEERVIAYFSCKLDKAQQNYSATEKECLAVIKAVEKFRPYIDGTHFTVITDHASLLWLQTMRTPTGRLARWALRLQEYDFKLIHRKGKHNVVPDALSRIHMEENENALDMYEKKEIDTCATVTLNDFQSSTDPIYAKLCQTIQNQNKSGIWDKQYKYQNDLLYYLKRFKFEKKWVIYVPAEFTKQVLFQNHDDILAGHGGFFKTLKRIQHHYFWPKMRDEISQYCYTCQICQAAKPSNENNISPMGQFREPKYPWRMIATDFIGPLPRSKNGNAWILTVVDLFTKYTLAFPLRNATADLLCEKMRREVFFKFGMPETIVCDNGSQFISQKFSDMLSGLNIEKQHTSAYTPRQNASECYNKIIGTALKIFVDQSKHNTWDANLPEILCAMNTSTNTTTKKSPHEMLFCNPMIMDGQMHKVLNDVNNQSNEDQATKLSVLWDEARDALRQAYDAYKRQYDRKANRSLSYEPEEIVWKKNTVLSNKAAKRTAKIMPRRVQAIVLKIVGHNMYALGDPITRKGIGTFSSDMLSKSRQKPMNNR